MKFNAFTRPSGTWVACRVCGHPNRPDSRWAYNACAGCYHDMTTGRRHWYQALVGQGVIAAACFAASLLGMVAGLFLVGLPLDIAFGLQREGMKRTREIVVSVLMPLGVAVALWYVERQRRRGLVDPAPPEPLPMPPGASADRRRDTRVARITMGAVFAFMGFGFTLGRELDHLGLREDWQHAAALVVMVGLGAAAGAAYHKYRRYNHG